MIHRPQPHPRPRRHQSRSITKMTPCCATSAAGCFPASGTCHDTCRQCANVTLKTRKHVTFAIKSFMAKRRSEHTWPPTGRGRNVKSAVRHFTLPITLSDTCAATPARNPTNVQFVINNLVISPM